MIVAVLASAAHGIASANGRTGRARAASLCSMICSLGVVLLATALAG